MSYIYSPPASFLALKPWSESEELFLVDADHMPLMARIQKLAGEYGSWLSFAATAAAGNMEFVAEGPAVIDFRLISHGAFERTTTSRVFRISGVDVYRELEPYIGRRVKLRVEFRWREREGSGPRPVGRGP